MKGKEILKTILLVVLLCFIGFLVFAIGRIDTKDTQLVVTPKIFKVRHMPPENTKGTIPLSENETAGASTIGSGTQQQVKSQVNADVSKPVPPFPASINESALASVSDPGSEPISQKSSESNGMPIEMPSKESGQPENILESLEKTAGEKNPSTETKQISEIRKASPPAVDSVAPREEKTSTKPDVSESASAISVPESKTVVVSSSSPGIEHSSKPSADSSAKKAPQEESDDALPDGTFRPNEVDDKPKLLRADSPTYPATAKNNKIEGWVVLQFVVDTKGRAKKAEVLDAYPKDIFNEAALKVLRSYRFKPAQKDGIAVSCVLQQRVRFEQD
jgi:TonB family protein